MPSIANQVREAEAVCVVAPALTSKPHSWASDLDAEYREADARMRMLVGDLGSAGPAVSGRVGDEDPSRRLPTLSCSSRRMR